MGKVISILNQKGGVGKTTTTFNVAAVLAQRGYKVLMIDSDSQSSLTLMTGNNPLAFDVNLCDVYDGDMADKAIYQLNIENLYLLPSSISLAKMEAKLMTTMLGAERKAKKAIDPLRRKYDFIFIDCPPALGLLTINALVASDYLITPCETTNLSSYALEDLKDTVDAVKEVNLDLTWLGVIATRYNKVTKAHNRVLEELQEEHNVLGIVKNSVAIQAGIEEGLPCVIADPKSDVAKTYVEITETILNMIEGEK